jgi:hypothetical protein
MISALDPSPPSPPRVHPDSTTHAQRVHPSGMAVHSGQSSPPHPPSLGGGLGAGGLTTKTSQEAALRTSAAAAVPL